MSLFAISHSFQVGKYRLYTYSAIERIDVVAVKTETIIKFESQVK